VDEARILSLVDADAAAQAALEDRVVAQVVRTFEELDDWYDHDQITRLARRAGQLVRASSQATASRSDAYITRVFTEMLGGAPTAAGALRIVAPLRTGVSRWETVYGRIADTVRLELSRGKALDDAVGIGFDRADSIVRTDLGLARRAQWQQSITANPNANGYRRVIHPEMSKTGTCGLCIAAADRWYSRADLLPLHSRCKCSVLPITTALDPGRTLNDADLAGVYASADSTKAADLKRVRYAVREHGELGPVLTNARDHWRGPALVDAAA
jgi:hypothetical protein